MAAAAHLTVGRVPPGLNRWIRSMPAALGPGRRLPAALG